MSIKAELNEYRLHAVTFLTGASAAMSQITELSVYSPVAAALAFMLSATSYKGMLKRADKVVDALETAEVIDEEIADVVDEAIDTAEAISEAVE
tara:strand:+ start:1078 stop:1359 length:282 start_codon:yes stop_codon:yes gene_type:complete